MEINQSLSCELKTSTITKPEQVCTAEPKVSVAEPKTDKSSLSKTDVLKKTPIAQPTSSDKLGPPVKLTHEKPTAVKVVSASGSAIKGAKNVVIFVANYAPTAQELLQAGGTISTAVNVITSSKKVAGWVQSLGTLAEKIAPILKTPAVRAGCEVIGVAVGGYEIYDGVKTYKDDKGEGIHKTTIGVLDVSIGVAAALGATTVAPVLAAGKIGLEVGDFGDKEVKRLGMLKDANGNPESVSDRLGDRMWEIHDDVEKSTGSNVLGHVAAISSGVVMLPAGGVIAVAGAAAGAVDRAWTWVTK